MPFRAEPKVGIEPTAYALPRRCSTSELLGPAERSKGMVPDPAPVPVAFPGDGMRGPRTLSG